MRKFAVGFLFRKEGREVCLIHKNRPDWQKGRINGVGGQIEPGETPLAAMIREFQEEAGVSLEWRQFCMLKGSEYELYCFTTSDNNAAVKTMTDEKVGWYPVGRLPENIVANLTWLIPMANYKLPINAVVEHESPVC